MSFGITALVERRTNVVSSCNFHRRSFEFHKKKMEEEEIIVTQYEKQIADIDQAINVLKCITEGARNERTKES